MQRNGLAPTPEEIAAELGTTLEEVDEILLAARTAGHASLEDDISTPLFERLSDPHCSDPQGSAEWDETKALLVNAIHELTDQERTVITLYYGEELLLREIASVLDLTESRISQIHTRALYRLNRDLSARLGGAV
jgi:RNA polymerase sigma factor for flagellar operon FliA